MEWKIESRFKLNGEDYQVETVCHPSSDMIAAHITSKAHTGICFRFPYPTGGHCDDACNWEAIDKHTTTIVTQNESSAVLKHTLDSTEYYITLHWEGKATLNEKAKHYFVLTPIDDKLAFTCAFTSEAPSTQTVTVEQTLEEAKTIGTLSGKKVRQLISRHVRIHAPKNWNDVWYLVNICLLFKARVLLLRKKRDLLIIHGLVNFILK